MGHQPECSTGSPLRIEIPRVRRPGSRRHRGKSAKTHGVMCRGLLGSDLKHPGDSGPTPASQSLVVRTRGESDPDSVRDGRGPDHLILTVAPASSSSFLSFSASSLEMPVLISLGAASTRSLASLRPRAVAARTTLMTLILLAPIASSVTSNSVLGAAASAGAAAAGGAGDRDGGGGRLDPVNDLEVVAQRLGLEDGQLDDRLAQGLDVIGERRGFGGGHRGSGPFLLSRSDHDHCRGVRQTHRIGRNRKTARVRIRRTLPG